MKKMRRIVFTLLIMLCMAWVHVDTVEAAPASEEKLTKLTFDMDYYYKKYPDLQEQIGYDYDALYEHYVTFGMKEGRWGSKEFNCLIYKKNYADLQAAFGDDYKAYCVQYEVYGKKEGRNAKIDSIAQKGKAGNVIGSYSTLYDPDIPRATNIVVSASRINGMVIQPGESFSYSESVLPRNAENGYVKAPIVVGKNYTDAMGGGICQVSSTLYAAMLDAGLPATERHPHSIEVDYIPREMDAAIYQKVKDLKFDNIFTQPIQISASTENGVLTVTLSKL